MAVPKELPEWPRRILAMTDEEIGRDLRDKLFAAVRSGVANDFIVVRTLELISENFFDAAIRNPTEALHNLAYTFAIAGQTGRAGRAYRAFFTEVFPLLRNAEIGQKAVSAIIESNLRRDVQSKTARELWRKVGLDIRQTESGWPMHNKQLAYKIVERTGGKYSTVYRAVPKLGLGAKEWRAKRRNENCVKQKQSASTAKKHTWNKKLSRRR